MALKRLNMRWKNISVIFITHTHADHVTGLPGMLMLSAQVSREKPLIIIGPKRIKDYVDKTVETLEMYLNYEIDIREIPDWRQVSEVYREEDISVKSIPLKHGRPCVGYIIEEDPRPGIFYPEKAKEARVPCGPLWARLQKGCSVRNADGREVHPEEVLGRARAGRKFSYMTDTSAVPAAAEWVKDSDLLICEGMFDESLKENAAEKQHMTAAQAAALAQKAGGVKKMGLTHFSPRYGKFDLELLKKEASAVFPASFLCRDLMEIPVPYPTEDRGPRE